MTRPIRRATSLSRHALAAFTRPEVPVRRSAVVIDAGVPAKLVHARGTRPTPPGDNGVGIGTRARSWALAAIFLATQATVARAQVYLSENFDGFSGAYESGVNEADPPVPTQGGWLLGNTRPANQIGDVTHVDFGNGLAQCYDINLTDLHGYLAFYHPIPEAPTSWRLTALVMPWTNSDWNARPVPNLKTQAVSGLFPGDTADLGWFTLPGQLVGILDGQSNPTSNYSLTPENWHYVELTSCALRSELRAWPLGSGRPTAPQAIGASLGEARRLLFTGPNLVTFEYFIDSVRLEALAPINGIDCNANGIADECEPDCDGNGIPDDCEGFADCNANGIPDVCDLSNGTSVDCNGNGLPDECDIASGTSTDCDGNGVPDECDLAGGGADCNANGVLDACDIALGTSTDCDGNGVPDECDLAGGGADCNANGALDACDIALGTSADCNGNGVPDECELASGAALDCNANGILDDCDLAFGTSLDCDANGVPDECDLASGAALDCNRNGVPDSCDIASGTSLDTDLDGVPDECQLDCNGNGVSDLLDIANGTSSDCDGDGVPDECQIAGGAADCNANGVLDACELASGAETDCNGNGALDGCDLASGASLDCNANGIPDECEPDCNGNGVPDDCDLASGSSLDCNANGVPDECDLAAGTSLDCDANGIPDECQIAGGAPDCNANGVLDSCEFASGQATDCDGNGVLDECDLAGGAPDCNGNGVLDSCDIAAGASADCNANGVPDECDLASGTSADCNENQVPDECEAALIVVDGFAPGTDPFVSTTGGLLTLRGEFLRSGVDGMSARLKLRGSEVDLAPSDLVASPAGDELTIVLPAIAPGCDCSIEPEIPFDLWLDNGCEGLWISSAGLEPWYAVHRIELEAEVGGVPVDLQGELDVAPEGSCLVLVTEFLDSVYTLPGDVALRFDASHARLTLTSAVPTNANRYYLQGAYLDNGTVPLAPVVHFETAGDELCLSWLTLTKGNSGLWIEGPGSPRIRGCYLTNNLSDSTHGGGLSVFDGATPLVDECRLQGNRAGGDGGGLSVRDASGVYVDNWVTNNLTDGDGGGVALRDTPADLALVRNDIDGNDDSGGEPARHGGGIAWWRTDGVTQDSGLVFENRIAGNACAELGAGLYIGANVEGRVFANSIRGNYGTTEHSAGGGIYVDFGQRNPELCENEIVENSAQRGGGLALMEKTIPIVERNFVACNRAVQHPADPLQPSYAAGILCVDNSTQIRHNTIWQNTGFAPGDPELGGPQTVDQQAGGIHFTGLSPNSFLAWENVLAANTGWELFSDKNLGPTFVDYTVGWDADAQVFSPKVFPSGAPATAIVADPLFDAPACQAACYWKAFALSAGSPAIGLTPDGASDAGAVAHDRDRGGDCLAPTAADCDASGIQDAVELVLDPDTDLDSDGVHDGCDALGVPYCFADPCGAGCPCGHVGSQHEGCPNSSTRGARLVALGSLSVAADDLHVYARDLPRNQAALLFVGATAPGGGDGIPFGEGLRCVGGSTVRLGVRFADGGGHADWGPGLGAIGGWGAGDTRRLQVWFRDPNYGCGSGFGLSHALELVLEP